MHDPILDRQIADLRQTLLRLRCEVAWLRFMDSFRSFAIAATKAGFNPGQLRIPSGQPGGGRWTDGGGGDYGVAPDGTPVEPAQGRRRGSGPGDATPGELTALALARSEAVNAVRRAREQNPNWTATQQLTDPNNVQGLIEANRAVAREAEQYLQGVLRDAIPNANPSWSVNRLRKELYRQGYTLDRETDAPGLMYRNDATGEQVRIMERPPREYRNDPPQKHANDYYYRYQPGKGKQWGGHISIPNAAD